MQYKNISSLTERLQRRRPWSIGQLSLGTRPFSDRAMYLDTYCIFFKDPPYCFFGNSDMRFLALPIELGQDDQSVPPLVI